jgi:hypothetical protein
MKAIPDATRSHLPANLRDFRWQARSWLVQIHYGHPRLHYEVWSLRRRNLLELGLWNRLNHPIWNQLPLGWQR